MIEGVLTGALKRSIEDRIVVVTENNNWGSVGLGLLSLTLVPIWYTFIVSYPIEWCRSRGHHGRLARRISKI